MVLLLNKWKRDEVYIKSYDKLEVVKEIIDYRIKN